LVSGDSSETAREEWVGTASILTPTMWAQSDADTYGVVGMWVHPEHRRKGRWLFRGLTNLIIFRNRAREETARIWNRVGSHTN
jgi:GNAT superfamily N-acetyltransferase